MTYSSNSDAGGAVRRGCGLGLAAITLVIGVVIGLVVAGGGLLAAGRAPWSGLLPSLFGPMPTVTPTIKSGPTVLNAIQAEAKLQTITMNIATDTDVTRVSGLRGVCTEKLTYLAYYNVKAGIDLAKVTPAQVSVTNDGLPDLATVTITLPQAELLGIERDEVNSRIVAEQKPPALLPGCEDHGGAMLGEAQQKTRLSAQTLALDRDILRLAEDKAGQELRRILMTAGYKNVVIRNSRGE